MKLKQMIKIDKIIWGIFYIMKISLKDHLKFKVLFVYKMDNVRINN